MPINEQLSQEIKEFSDEKLSLKEWELNDDDVEELLPALQSNPHIKELDLSLNYITSKGAKILLTSLSKIEVFNLQGNDISSEGLNELDLTNCRLRTLDISSNSIGDTISVFSNIPTLTELNASECEITDEGVKKLFSSFYIKKLNLTSNDISGTSFENLATNHTLEILYLAQNSLLADNLKHLINNDTLVTLDLTNTFICDEGANLLAQNTCLQELYLMQCLIRDVGAKAFGESKNKNLEKLILSNNEITHEGAMVLIKNKFILRLDLTNNPCNRFVDLSFLQKQHYTKSFDGVFVRNKEQRPTITDDDRRSSNSSNSSSENSLGPSSGRRATSPPKSSKNTLRPGI